MIEIKLKCETCGGFGGDDERNCPACLGKGWIWAPTPEAAATAPVAFAGDVLALDEFLATKFASPLERQAWARIRALVDGRQKGQATASPGEAPDPSEPFHARKTIRSQAAELKLWHEAYGPIPPAPGEAPADLREAVALAVTDYSAGGEDISHTVDRILSLVHPQAPKASPPQPQAQPSEAHACPFCKHTLKSRDGFYTCSNRACSFPLGIAPAPKAGAPTLAAPTKEEMMDRIHTVFSAGPHEMFSAPAGGAGSQAPGALRWTKENPTREGWYWLSFQVSAPEIVHVRFDPVLNRLEFFDTEYGNDSHFNLEKVWENAVWAGPIPEPAAEGPAGGAQ